jgi:hypothetical protein
MLMKLITGGRTTISGRAAHPSSSEAAAETPTTSTLKRNAFKVGKPDFAIRVQWVFQGRLTQGKSSIQLTSSAMLLNNICNQKRS